MSRNDDDYDDYVPILPGTSAFPRVARHWCGAWNNYPDSWEDDVSSLRELCRHAVWGRERAPTTGTPHLQFHLSFRTPRSFAWLKRQLPHARLEFVKSRVASSEYCRKSGDFVEWGVESHAGERTDLTEFYSGIRNGATVQQLFEDFPAATLRYHSAITRVQLEFFSARTEPPVVWWIHGPTGVGKTKFAYDRDPGLWSQSDNLKWFDGYHGQEAVLLDDLRAHVVPFSFLLRLLDRYPLKVPVKGGFVNWIPKRIYITSCYTPEECFPDISGNTIDTIGQLLRRITHNKEMF